MSRKSRISASEQAQLLLDQAMDASTETKARRLIEQAVEVDPQCVDGWNLLADFAETHEEALELFQRSVKIGRDRVGNRFRELIGVFWLDTDTRPYMRALEGLAQTWRAMGKWSDAIAVWETMLELNPNDNQGVRWPLLEALLFTGDNLKAATLVDSQYPDDAYALWNWARWLLAFRNRQPENQLRELMHNAHENNSSVVKWLLGDKPLPAEMPSTMVLGEKSEALCVASGFLPAFTSTPGAKTWLRRAAMELNLDQSPGPEQLKQHRVDSMNQAKEVDQQQTCKWMVQHRKFKFEGEPVWAVLVAVGDSLSLRSCQILESSPKPDDILDSIVSAIVQPAEGQPLRPGVVRFSLKTMARSLAKRLGQLNIQSEVGPSSEMDEAFEAFRLTLGQGPLNRPRHSEPFVDPE